MAAVTRKRLYTHIRGWFERLSFVAGAGGVITSMNRQPSEQTSSSLRGTLDMQFLWNISACVHSCQANHAVLLIYILRYHHDPSQQQSQQQPPYGRRSCVKYPDGRDDDPIIHRFLPHHALPQVWSFFYTLIPMDNAAMT
jgi:hypothetical protein